MTGVRQKLSVAFTDTTLPKASPDDLLVAGSLMLLEPGNPNVPAPAGVPANAALLPNLAQSYARDALANQTAEVRPAWVLGSSQGSSNSIFERTTKGGLHGIVSQVDTGNNKGAGFTLPATLLTYLLTNKAHAFYASLWCNITRASGGGVDGTTPFLSYVGDNTGGIATNYLYALRSRITRPTTLSLGVRPGASGTDVTGVALRNIGANGNTGTTPAGWVGMPGSWGKPGYSSNADAAADTTHMPSWVLYRYYLEDLTVSGRSYATVDALDLAAYQAAVTTIGGRYYGDTYTNPSTLA